MIRTLEPELMLDPDQAVAYAEADFLESDAQFVQRFKQLFGASFEGEIIDLGCGPGNIALRMADAFPECAVTGIDGAPLMLEIARSRVQTQSNADSRIRFVEAVLPISDPPAGRAAAVVSNSLLHHLHDPSALWQTIKALAAPNAAVLIVDLRRPEAATIAQRIVDTYAGSEPEILRNDFYNSLLAAFEVNEVKDQLDRAGLADFTVQPVGDRYLEVFGRIPG